MAAPRVLVVHNRYRVEGGEERSVALQLRALADAGVEHRLLERRSEEAGRARAALALLRGGEREDEVATAVRALAGGVAHVHNMLPLLGPRALSAAREAGARVVLHLHNARLFCSIGVASRDGGPCFRCRGRLTLPGFVLNCRDSVAESAVYTTALSLHQPGVFAAVDRMVAPSAWAAGQLERLGAPRVEVLRHYLPAAAFAERSAAGEGSFALVAARLSAEKGVDVAIAAAAESGVPLRVAGEGPKGNELRERAERLGAPVEFLGRVPQADVRGLMREAAMILLPSRYHEFSPFAVLEAMAAGVPVVATPMGGVPELVGAGRCVPMNDPAALAARVRELMDSPERRREEGDALIARARERHSQERFTSELLALYERL